MPTNKSLGQHWLKDREVLDAIADAATISEDDTVLEIGPGLGTLTSSLLKRAKKVVAVEFDAALAKKLPAQFPGKNLEVITQDILDFNLDSLPKKYRVVANVPYYITSKIVQKLMTADNKPSCAVLLVQKEVAERIAADAGQLSILGIAAQIYATASLDVLVPAHFFTPPPKVDSQVVVLTTRPIPLVEKADEAHFFRIVKSGFMNKRKKVAASLAGILHMPKSEVLEIFAKIDISENARAQELTLEQWCQLAKNIT